MRPIETMSSRAASGFLLKEQSQFSCPLPHGPRGVGSDRPAPRWALGDGPREAALEALGDGQLEVSAESRGMRFRLPPADLRKYSRSRSDTVNLACCVICPVYRIAIQPIRRSDLALRTFTAPGTPRPSAAWPATTPRRAHRTSPRAGGRARRPCRPPRRWRNRRGSPWWHGGPGGRPRCSARR